MPIDARAGFHQAAKLGGTALALVLLSACSQVPVATTYQVTAQHKMQSAGHWRHLAGEVCDDLKKRVASDAAVAARPIHLASQQAPTPFNQAFHSYLVTECMNKGVVVSLGPDNAHVLKYTTQLVPHQADMGGHAPGWITGAAAFASVAAGVLADAPLDLGEAIGLGMATAVAADAALGAYARPTNTEMVFTASLWDSGVIRYRRSETVYVNTADYALYEPAPLELRAGKVVYY